MWLVGRPLHSAALIDRPGIVITSVPYQMAPDVGDGDAPVTGGNG